MIENLLLGEICSIYIPSAACFRLAILKVWNGFSMKEVLWNHTITTELASSKCSYHCHGSVWRDFLEP